MEIPKLSPSVWETDLPMRNCLFLSEPDLQISNKISNNRISCFLLVQTTLVEHTSQRMKISLFQKAGKK
jgi:hypothetical protein